MQITWIDGLGNVLHRGIKTTKELFDDGPLYTVKSVLRVMPRKDHDNTTFTCQSQNAADRTPQNAKLRVEVSGGRREQEAAERAEIQRKLGHRPPH